MVNNSINTALTRPTVSFGSTTAKAARDASIKHTKANRGLINKNFQLDSAKSELGLNECQVLKKRGRGGDGNRIPDTADPLRLHLQNNDRVTILLDEFGGSYIKRNSAFSVSTHMRLRYVEARKHLGIASSSSSSGSDGDNEDDGEYIVYVTKRSTADRNTTKQVEENLSRLSLFKFVKDETEHAGLKEIFMDHELYDDLRRLFRHYAYGGAGDAFSMDVGEWEMCCKDAGVLDNPGMTYGKVDTVFIAANYTAKASNKEALKKAQRTGGKINLVAGNPDNAFTLYEFIEGLCRLSLAMYPNDGKQKSMNTDYQDDFLSLVTYADKVQVVLNQHFVPLAKTLSSNWDMFDDIESKEVQNVYHARMLELENKFRMYCKHRKKNVRRMHLTMDGYIELIESSGLLREDDVLVTVSTTHRVIRECFIWSQRKATGDHSNVHQEEQSLNKMDFGEFLESLALLAYRTYFEHPEWLHVSGAHAEHLGVKLEELLNVLLASRRVGMEKK